MTLEAGKQIRNNKLLLLNTAILYIKFVLSIAISLASVRILLEILGESNFGVFNVVAGTVTIFTVFSGMFSGTGVRFMTYELGQGNEKRLNVVFNAVWIAQIAIAIVSFICIESIGLYLLKYVLNIPEDISESAVTVFHIITVAFIFNILSIPCQVVLNAYENFAAFSVLELLRQFNKLASLFLLIYLPGNKIVLYAWLLLINEFCQLLLYIGYYFYRYRNVVKPMWRQDWAVVREIVLFSGYSCFGGFACIGKQQAVVMLLNVFFGTVVNASYAIGLNIQNTINMLGNIVSSASAPQIIKLYSNRNRQEMFLLVNQVSKIYFAILFCCCCIFFFNANFIFILWLKRVPEYCVAFTTILLVDLLFSNLTQPLITVANATGNIRIYQVTVGGILLLTFPGTWLLCWMGFSPVAVISFNIVVALAAMVARIFWLKRLAGMELGRYCREVLLRLGIFSIYVLPGTGICLLFTDSGWLRLLISIGLIVFFGGSGGWFLLLSPQEQVSIRMIVKKQIGIYRKRRLSC